MSDCHFHPGRDGVGGCVNCGKIICAECKTLLGDKTYCQSCAEKLFAAETDSVAKPALTNGPAAKPAKAGGDRPPWLIPLVAGAVGLVATTVIVIVIIATFFTGTSADKATGSSVTLPPVTTEKPAAPTTTPSSSGSQMAAVPPQENKGTISTGTTESIAIQTIEPSGGTITINKPGNPLHGMEIVVPQGSYSSSKPFKISSAPITGNTFQDITPISPLITIDNGGGYAGAIMMIKVPVKVPEGHFAMGFFYDRQLGSLEGMLMLEETPTSITLGSRHFCDFFISVIEDRLLQTFITSRFLPGFDDWQFKNRGSQIAPKGHCAGQVMAALWYYCNKPDGASAHLWGKYDNYGREKPTKDLWQDDNYAYRLCSVVQNDIWWKSWANELFTNLEAVNDELTWKAFAYSIKATGEPQYIGITNRNVGGHAMICYAVENGTLWIADPNYPSENRIIEFAGGKFVPYRSGANAGDIEAGRGTNFELIGYCAKTAIADWNLISTRWEEMKNKTIGNDKFPQYKLVWLDSQNKAHDLVDGTVITDKMLNLEVNFQDGKKAYPDVFLNGKEVAWRGTYELNELQPGENLLGVCVKHTWGYVDFGYVKVYYDKVEASQFSLNCQVSDFKVNRDKSIWDPVPGLEFVPSYEWNVSITTMDPATKQKTTRSQKYQSASVTFTPPKDWVGISAQYGVIINERTSGKYVGGAQLVSLSMGRDTGTGQATGYSAEFKDSHDSRIYNRQFMANVSTRIAVPGGVRVTKNVYSPAGGVSI